MVDVVIAVVAKVAEYAVVPVLRPVLHHAQFLFCAGKIKRNLNSMKKLLELKKGLVEQQKQEARNRNEIAVEAVEEWLKEVSKVMAEVGPLVEQMQEGSSCCWGWCSTLKGYRLCKKFAKITYSMKGLNQNGEFNPFSYPIPISDIEFFPENFVYFESRELTSEQLLKALRDDSACMIGLYGMGGCGKTTLVEEIGKKAKELKLFDHVLFTTVSQPINVKKIQDEIAGLLRFKFESEIEAVRARELSLRLQNGDKHLIILDDVWSGFNLAKDVGIPLHNNCKGCKVLLTTRRQQVCDSMDCKRKIELRLLSDEEAWTLFQKNTCIVDESVAQDIVKECKGLPIAIVTVARSLTSRSIHGWKVALHNLRTSKPVDVEEGERDAYTCLEMSYNYLQKEEAKLLLKICSIFPEDHRIPLEELLRYGIGLGICKEVNSFEEARNIVDDAIEGLVYSSLLFYEIYMGQRFLKIHDLVRDVILWIASKENASIMVDPEKDLNNGSMEDCYAISLWDKKIDQFPQYLVAPKLRFLLLQAHDNCDFSQASSEGIKELKVMSMFPSGFTSLFLLAFSTQQFDNLHTLRLAGLKIDDISFVVNLRRLKILDLRGSHLKKLPNGIENTNELKLMDLTFCTIEDDCHEVLRRCSQLAELYISVALPYECFLYNTFPKLQRYHLTVGSAVTFHRDVGELRDVKFQELNISNSCATIKDLLQRAMSVILDRLVGGCKSIIPEFCEAAGAMDELTELHLQSCSEIECIIDCTTFDYAESFRVCAMLPKLVKLGLAGMNNLKEIIRGPPSLLCVFEKLDNLSIHFCGKLESLFPLSVAQSLRQLKFLDVSYCFKLKHIILNEGNTGTDAVKKEIFPNLKRISVKNCYELECVFPISVASTLLSLEKIKIFACDQLKSIVRNEGEGASTHNSCLSMFSQLREISVSFCYELECITWEFNQTIQQRQLSSNMEQGILEANASELRNEISTHYIGKLERLELKNLSALSSIWMVPSQSLMLQYLHSLTINGCGKLKSLFPTTIHYNFPELTVLDISSCEELEEIMTDNEESLNLSNTQPCFPKLQQLKVLGCNKLKCLFSVSIAEQLPQLEELYISQAGQLEQAFRYKMADVSCNIQKILLPNLRKLTLHELPNFVSICMGLKVDVVKLQLMELIVHECPKFDSIYVQCSTEGYRLNGGNTSDIGIIKDILQRESSVVLRPLTRDGMSFWKRSFDEAGGLLLFGCSKIECIIDTTTSDHVESFRVRADSPKLVKLELEGMGNLKEIIRGPPPLLCIFEKLQYLFIKSCGMLTSLFPLSVAQSLKQLKVLNVSSCHELKHIILSEENDGIDTQPCFQKLQKLEVIDCDKLKYLFSVSIAEQLSQLEELYISRAAQLGQAFRYKMTDVSYNIEKILLPNLRKLTLRELPNFVDNCLRVDFMKLQEMEVRECPRFDSIYLLWSKEAQMINDRQVCNEVSYLDGSSDQEEQEKIITPNLGLLYLDDLPDLMFIWTGPTLVNIQNLVLLKVVACRKLKFIFPACVVRNLPALQCLIIKDCEELEQDFGYESENHDDGGKVIELALLKLAILGLFRLPKFTNFGGHLEFQLKLEALKCYKVQDCPKIFSTTLASLENFLPAHKSDTENFNYLDIGDDDFDGAVFLNCNFDEPNETDSEEESKDANSDKKD